MRLFMFLVFSQYGLASKYGITLKYQTIIGCRITLPDTWCNKCQSNNAIIET